MVQECMDMFRQAAELYSAAGDSRHKEVSKGEGEGMIVLVEEGGGGFYSMRVAKNRRKYFFKCPLLLPVFTALENVRFLGSLRETVF